MLFMVTHPKRMSRSSLLCNGVVDGILHQAVANDAESEDSKKQIQKSGVAGISFDTVTAVSYTHLDVYKRQIPFRFRLHTAYS